MNKVILMGRLTRTPEVRYSQSAEPTAIARYTLAVDRRFKREGDEQTADFITCIAFGRAAEFAELLRQRLPDIPIELFDERMTTMAASRYLNETNTGGQKRKNVIDTLSAQIILQNFLDRLRKD